MMHYLYKFQSAISGDYMSIDYKILGKRIKAQRLIKRKTREHFAESMDVSARYITT